VPPLSLSLGGEARARTLAEHLSVVDRSDASLVILERWSPVERIVRLGHRLTINKYKGVFTKTMTMETVEPEKLLYNRIIYIYIYYT
jgi:hypothetical protein